MKRLILIAVVSLVCSCYDRKIKTFKVVDSKSLEPLPLVTITVNDSSFYSDDEGLFLLNIEQRVVLRCLYLGYCSMDTFFLNLEYDTIMIYLDESRDFDSVDIPVIEW